MTRGAAAHLSLAAGAALYALALPPFDFSLGAWVALVPLILLAERATPRTAAALGAAAGFYAAWAVTWWLPQAIAAYFQASLLHGAASISLAYVLAVSSTFGAFAWTVARLRPVPPVLRVLGIAAAWTALEAVRARGFDDPWALLGYTQYRTLPLLQLVSVTGVYGLSFLVALGNAAVALTVGTRGGGPAALAAAIIGATWVGGAAALPQEPVAATPLRVAILQPDIAPAHTWTRGYSERQLARAVAQTRAIPAGDVDLVVWPENSVTLYPEHEPYVGQILTDTARRLHADLLVGAPRDTGDGVANSARLIRPDGSWQHYDKQRLVPFAETPVGLSVDDEALASASPRHFRAGVRPGVLTGRTVLGVSICHEALYPETVHPAVAAGATLLVNIANDGWLDGGYGVASRQHFAMAAVRAVEARRYLVRAAVGGVSGVVDPWGRIELAQDAAGVVAKAWVHPRTGVTVYVRYGDWFPGACAGAVGALFALLLAPRRARRRIPVPAPL